MMDILWDLKAVLNAAKTFLENSVVSHAEFHVFCQDAKYVSLFDKRTSEL